jgi:hypothetical protein
MGFIKKLFGKQDEPGSTPAWASFMSAQRFQSFKSVLEAQVRRRHPAPIIDWESGTWTSSRDSQAVNGLMNLAQMCAPLNDHETATEIDRFLSFGEASLKPKEPRSFEAVKELLKLRLYPLDMVGADILVLAPYSDSFRTALVLDYPDHVATVNRENAESWGVPSHELFRIGLKNVLRHDPVEADAPADGVLIIQGPSFFTASHALLLDRHIEIDENVG